MAWQNLFKKASDVQITSESILSYLEYEINQGLERLNKKAEESQLKEKQLYDKKNNEQVDSWEDYNKLDAEMWQEINTQRSLQAGITELNNLSQVVDSYKKAVEQQANAEVSQETF